MWTERLVKMTRVLLTSAAMCLLLMVVVHDTRAAAVDFVTEVEPIIRTNCLDCHGPEEQNGRFRLDQLAVMLRGGDSGERAVVPGDPAASFLVKLIKHQEPGLEMPPEASLTPGQIELIEQWISEGARTPASYGPATATDELAHWSFRPLTRPESADSIDGFITRKLTERGLDPSPEADRRVLIRRLYLVMHGLPPTPQQVEEFVDDARPDAWERLVEDALASPRYGERWATYWLDLVRFGETHGFETNRERPNAWPYRDWVIGSLNHDKPYDEFVREQLAGDALGVDVATGFLVAGPYDQVKGQDPKLQQVQRMNELDDIINTTGTAFLGLTTGCARCHNHKFDPITQRDYYAMQAVFAGVQHGDRPLPTPPDRQRQIADLDTRLATLRKGLARFVSQSTLRPAVSPRENVEEFPPQEARFVRFTIAKTNQGQPCIDELEVFSGTTNVALGAGGAKATSGGDFVHPLHKLEHINDGKHGNSRSWIAAQASGGWVQVELPEVASIQRIVWARDREGKYQDRLATEYRIESSIDGEQWTVLGSSDDRAAITANTEQTPQYDFAAFPDAEAAQGRASLALLERLSAERSELAKQEMIYAGSFSQPGPTHRLYRGEPDAKREPVAPDAIEVFTSLGLDESSPEQERRRIFADWVASEQNPLTPRVIVNRLWQFHFGTGIVDTPSDFGQNGTPPTHPELLDWLACELINNNWSLKAIHRSILNSETWRQSHQPRPGALRVDAGSRLLWRFPPRRLEAEAIRDSILSVSGALDLEPAGGPGFSAFAVELENVRHYHEKAEYGPEDWRRMIYMTRVRQEKDQVFGAFDCPDASMVVPQRSRSTTPLQALSLLNSRFVMQQAELFAQRLQSESPDVIEQVGRAWELCFQHQPTDNEIAVSREFIEQAGLVQFTRALLNANEFVFIP